MKKSKRILAAVLALALVLVLAACGKSSVKDTAYAAQKVDSAGGTIVYAYDVANKTVNLKVTTKVQTFRGNGTNINYGFVNYRDFDSIQDQNASIITGDCFIYNPLFRSGKIETIRTSYPFKGKKQETAVYHIVTNSKHQVTEAQTGSELTEYDYNGKGNIAQISYYYADQSGKKDGHPYCIVTYTYDKQGNVVTFKNQADSGYSQTRTDTFQVKYDKDGRGAAIIGSNGSTQTYSYNAEGRPVQIVSTGKMDAKTVTTITYDENGNIAKISGVSTSLADTKGVKQEIVFSGYQKV